MANDTTITVIGNLTADPELRFTQSGVPVANFTIASTPRTFDKQTNEWKDGEALFLRSSIWRDAAENVAETLHKGDRVIAQGNLVQRAFTDKDGNNRTAYELNVDEVGPSLKYAKASVQKVQRGQGQGQPRPSGQGEQWGAQNAPQAQPWGNVAQPGQGFAQPQQPAWN